jgi:hypothetical protein
MRIFIIFLLSCASVFGADSGIQVVSTATTNAATATISMRDVFTRNGQTNLVRTTKIKRGAVEGRIHRIYHDGVLVVDFAAVRGSSGFTVEAGCPYSVTFEFWPSKDVRSVVVGTKDGIALDAFGCTNGVFSPMESSVLQKANAVGADMKQLFDPEHVRKSTPEGFVREAEKLIEKHKEK